MKKVYNKLVRDRIPRIIKKDGWKPSIKRLNKAEFKLALLEKAVEEAKELKATKGDEEEMVKEIGDIYEVIDSLIELYKLDKKEIKKTKEERKKTRGGFEKRIFLEYVE